MTAQKSPDAVDFTIAYLLQLGATWPKRPIDNAFPYRIVRLASGEGDTMTSDSVVSVHTCAGTFGDAKAEAWRTHDHMMLLVDDPSIGVVMPDGSTVNAENVGVVLFPMHVDYGDTATERFVARYQLDFDSI